MIIDAKNRFGQNLNFLHYSNEIKYFSELKLTGKIKTDNFPINKPVYWKKLRTNGEDSLLLRTWFKGVCTYNSFQHTLIKKEDDILEMNYSSIAGNNICFIEEENLALFLILKDYLMFMNDLEDMFKDVESIFPSLVSTIKKDKKIPDYYLESQIFSDSFKERLHWVKSHLEHYNEILKKIKTMKDFLIINDENELIELNIKKQKFFIFDLIQQNIEEDFFKSVIKKLCHIKKNDFHVAVLNDENAILSFAHAIRNLN